MVRLLTRVLINLGTAAIGLLVAAWLVDGVRVTVSGFLVAVAVFTVAQAILTPFIVSIARKHASPVLGGIGLISTLVALFVATLLPGGLTISGLLAWVLAPLVVWVVTALGGWILVAVLLKDRTTGRQEKRAA